MRFVAKEFLNALNLIRWGNVVQIALDSEDVVVLPTFDKVNELAQLERKKN